MVDQHAVREASQQDIDRVVELWAEHLDFHAQFDPRFLRRDGSEDGFAHHLRSHLGNTDFLLLVVEIDGREEGFLLGELSDYPPCFENRAHGVINDLAVSPRWRRAGLGTALLEKGMAWFSAKGVPTVEGRVLMSNPVAMAFWQKAGFEPYVQTVRASTRSHE
jgi:ribosomal protein S18 acetylase RimI-like enzyme